MDPGSLCVSVCLIMACLFGPAALSSGDTTSCPCPRIPPLNLTEPPAEGCHLRYRYQCVEGYVRKHGTSSLTKCNPDEHGHLSWSTPTLECIPDPKLPIPKTTPSPPTPPTPPPNTTATTATPTSRHTTWNTRVSEDGGTDSVESTSHGEEDSGTPTSEKARPMQNSTFSPRTVSSSTTSPPGANKGKVDSVTQTQGIQKTTVSPSNANRSTTTSPAVHRAAPTRLQTTVTASTFSSVTGQRDGKIKSVTQTVVKSQTTISTISPSTDNSSAISPPGAVKGDVAQTVGISVSLLVIICAVIGISFLLYKRKFKASIPLQTQEELRPINCAPAVPEAV